LVNDLVGAAAAMKGGCHKTYNNIDNLGAPGVTWRGLRPACRE
jgi:hypothetical protein